MSPSVHAVIWGDLNLLRCFVGSDIPTVVLTSDPDEPTLRSRFCEHSRIIAHAATAPRATLRHLETIGRELGDRPVLYYGTDAQLLLISRNREQLAPLYRFLLPPPDLVEKLVNKTSFGQLARDLSLLAPRTVLSSEITHASQILEHIELPCVMKPNTHVGWFDSEMIREEGSLAGKVLRADTRAELAVVYDKMRRFSDDFVIQENIPGSEEQIYSFHAYLNAEGMPLAYFVGKKLRTYPRRAGRSTYLELVKDAEVERVGLDMLRTMKFVGIVKIDFKRNPRDGKLYVLELNPRFNLWHYLGAKSGINLPRMVYEDLHGRSVAEYRTDIKWLSFLTDFKAFLRSYYPAGELSWRTWLRSYRARKIYDVFAWNDPYPFVVSSLQYMRQLYNRLR
jgi:predicted ATP-grasp superfamily ATP-dependent carboligase